MALLVIGAEGGSKAAERVDDFRITTVVSDSKAQRWALFILPGRNPTRATY